MATHSRVHAWRIPGMGSHRVGHDWSDLAVAAAVSSGWNFPDSASGKESVSQCRGHKTCGFNPWVRKIPCRRAWQSTPVFLPRESHEQRSLVGYSPWGPEELDMTEMTQHAHTSSDYLCFPMCLGKEKLTWGVAKKCGILMSLEMLYLIVCRSNLFHSEFHQSPLHAFIPTQKATVLFDCIRWYNS